MTEEVYPVIRTIAIIGGTGKEGKGLAYRWAKAGYTILIGSRQAEKAQVAAEELCRLAQEPLKIQGMTNMEAANQADLVAVTVPYAAHRETMGMLVPFVQGKIVIDVTVPLVPPKVSRVQMPAEGSAAQEAQAILGEGAWVVDAFQNISHEHLLHDEPVDCDVLVCGGNKAAREIVLGLVEKTGLTGWDAGPIENAVVVEGLTSVLIGINKRYGVKSSGIRITGVPRE